VNTSHTTKEEAERSREVARALAELERRAAEQGVRPFNAGDWLAGDDATEDPEEIRREVDDFLALRREGREVEAVRGRS
jgi:hypothetical protein